MPLSEFKEFKAFKAFKMRSFPSVKYKKSTEKRWSYNRKQSGALLWPAVYNSRTESATIMKIKQRLHHTSITRHVYFRQHGPYEIIKHVHVARIKVVSTCIPCRRLHVSCIGEDKIVVKAVLRRHVSTCIRPSGYMSP